MNGLTTTLGGLLPFATSLRAGVMAYIDMGSGSFLLQFLVAGIAGALFAVKIYWRRIVDRLKGRSPEKDTEDDGQDHD